MVPSNWGAGTATHRGKLRVDIHTHLIRASTADSRPLETIPGTGKTQQGLADYQDKPADQTQVTTPCKSHHFAEWEAISLARHLTRNKVLPCL